MSCAIIDCSLGWCVLCNHRLQELAQKLSNHWFGWAGSANAGGCQQWRRQRKSQCLSSSSRAPPLRLEMTSRQPVQNWKVQLSIHRSQVVFNEIKCLKKHVWEYHPFGVIMSMQSLIANRRSCLGTACFWGHHAHATIDCK